MISSVRLCMNHARRLKRRKVFKFEPGFNAIIGPNGTGKSTLLKAIYECEDCKRKIEREGAGMRLFDAKAMDPHDGDDSATGLREMVLKVRAKFSSHGESMKDALTTFDFHHGDCLLFDEPERGQDMESVLKIRGFLDKARDQGCQIIVASHHPVFWEGAHIIELKKGYARKILSILCNISCEQPES